MIPRQIQIKKIRQIAIAWTLIGIFIAIYDHLLLHSHISQGHRGTYSLWLTLLIDGMLGFVSGIMGGWLLTTINRKFRLNPYYYSLTIGGISFILISSFLILFFTMLITGVICDFQYLDGTWQNEFKEHLTSTLNLKHLLFWGMVTIFTQFSLQISEKFGPGNLWSILSGKYNTPKREKRIFMFLDLKGSTSIAEKIGEEKYHQFLQEVFSDITEPIIQSRAEIYQYVGDEIIISWNLQKQFRTEDCLAVFFAIDNKFTNKHDHYLQLFGVVPQFKAGAHIGYAIVGEVGIIKRDITYSGDLLNTCARIQGCCNELNASFLISKPLKLFLNLSEYSNESFKSKGMIQLKGKRQGMELFEVQYNNNP